MSAGGLDTVGSPAFTDEDSARYRAAGWWSDSTLSDAVRRNAEHSPDRCAYADDPGTALAWREFDDSADALAEQLAGVSRLALRAYDACQAGDEQDAKSLFDRLNKMQF